MVYKANNIETTAITNPTGLYYKAWFKMRKDGKQVTIVGYYATYLKILFQWHQGGTQKGITTWLVSCQEILGESYGNTT